MVITRVKTPLAQAFDIPIIGDDLSKVNHIIDLWSQPCLENAEVWAYALYHAAPTLLVSILKPELIDINIKHPGRKETKGKKMRFFPVWLTRGTIFEIPVPRWQVFRLFEFSQRIGFYFLVADATEDFVINWTSMAYQWQGCQQADPAPAFTFERQDISVWRSGAAVTNQLFNQGSLQFIQDAQLVGGTNRVRILKDCIPMFQMRCVTKPFNILSDCLVRSWRIMSNQSQDPIADGRMSGAGQSGSEIILTRGPYGSFPAGSEFWVEYTSTEGTSGLEYYQWSMTSTTVPLDPHFGPDP